MRDDRDNELLTVKEYAERRRVHIQTVYAAIRRGLLSYPVERIGRSIRIVVSRESIIERKAS
jgi:predicted site-specific integrase-resolvase